MKLIARVLEVISSIWLCDYESGEIDNSWVKESETKALVWFLMWLTLSRHRRNIFRLRVERLSYFHFEYETGNEMSDDSPLSRGRWIGPSFALAHLFWSLHPELVEGTPLQPQKCGIWALVRSLAQSDSCLHLWTTIPHLFRYKAIWADQWAWRPKNVFHTLFSGFTPLPHFSFNFLFS